MSEPLADCLTRLERRVIEAEGLAIFLDFDGTLAPLVDDPGDAALPQATRSLLEEMASLPDVSLTLISGRALEDLRQRAAIEPAAQVIFAGCHGMEIAWPGLTFREPTAESLAGRLREITAALTRDLERFRGALVEYKELCAVVHFRLTPEGQRDALEEAVRGRLAPADDLFLVRRGAQSLEILPRCGWNKGRAAAWILEDYPGWLPVCAGDDSSDEDLFEVLTGSISVRVGEAPSSAARYHVGGTDDLRSFLAWLWATRLCSPKSGSSYSLRSRSKAALIRPR
jgi:trehalose 6-phosphate phosphatase